MTDTGTPLSAADIQTYRRDGVVALHGQFDRRWIETLHTAIDQSLALPSPTLHNHSLNANQPAYYEDFWSWSRFAGFRQFIFQSPGARIAAELLGARTINLVMDNWFLRAAGAHSRPPFHHDISYFDFAGSMCVLWLPLEAIDKANGIAWVRGSHKWGKLFMRSFFNDGHKTAAATEVNGERYELAPDINADPSQYDLAQFDLAVGDCVYFDIRTLHGGLSSTLPTKTSRRYTLRMAAEDGRIQYRGDWAKSERATFEAAGYRNGDRLSGDFFPQLWPTQ